MYDTMGSFKLKAKSGGPRQDCGDQDYENGHTLLTSTVSQEYQALNYESVNFEQPWKKSKYYQKKSVDKLETKIESEYFDE